MKTIIGLNQFFKQNTPKVAEFTGNVGLILAAITGFIMSTPALCLEMGYVFVLPLWALLIVKYCTVGGIFVKLFSKFWGMIDNFGNPVSAIETPKI